MTINDIAFEEVEECIYMRTKEPQEMERWRYVARINKGFRHYEIHLVCTELRNNNYV